MSLLIDYIEKGACTVQQVALHFGVDEHHVHDAITRLIDQGCVENAQNDVFIGEEFGVYLFDKTYQKVN